MSKNTIIIGSFEFPAECPKDCPGHLTPFSQGNLCHRCPIFNCKGVNNIRLSKLNYRKDWAEAWHKWFKSGMKGFPELYLK